MKTGKVILIVVLVIAAIAGAGFYGLKYGTDLVRNGIVANYPTIKNVVHGAVTEFDSTAHIILTKSANEELFNYLKGDLKTDTIQFSMPYYGRYGVDLSVRNFRVFKNDDGAIEVWVPGVMLRYCELKFDGLVVNGKVASTLLQSANSLAIRKKLYEYMIPVLEKNKANLKAAKTTTTKAMMFYIMPYKMDLKLYIGEELQTLPNVPGVNQSVEDAIKEAVNP